MSFQEEGSSEIDNGTVPYVSDQGSSENDEIEVREEGEGEGEGSAKPEGEGEGEGEGKPTLTEKGTKLDPNPQSAIHQQLANERKIRAQYEQVLSDPTLLRKYAKEAGISLEEAKAEIKEEQKKLYTPENFKSAQDLANALNELQGNFTKVNETITSLKEENQRLRGELDGINGSRRVEQVASIMGNDVAIVREKYPQLNPKSPEFDPELEKEIGSFYFELDAVDQSDPSKGFKGQYSLAKITDRFMRVRGEGAKKGSQQAQTIVKTKQAGKVVTSVKGDTKDTATQSSDPGTSIAQKIARTLGKG